MKKIKLKNGEQFIVETERGGDTITAICEVKNILITTGSDMRKTVMSIEGHNLESK